jgi:predicted dehydrogenase
MSSHSYPTTIRWGILGTGNIANSFAKGLASVDDGKLVAVGSRSQASADAFADRYAAPKRHATYAGLYADPEVDAIYIATPHAMHLQNMLDCLDAGKAVLCEKPFTINAAQARQAIERARSSGLFLMEAMWARFLPMMDEVRRLLAEGTIGEVRMVSADFGFRTKFNPQGRLFDPTLGGGALLDVGVYPVSLAHMVLGTPNRIASMAHLGETGIDEQSAYLLGYEGGALAQLSSAIRTKTPHEALIAGTEGSIRIHSPWWIPTVMTVQLGNNAPHTYEFPIVGNGYNYEINEVQRCMRAGKTESALMPLDETLAIMTTLDTLRGQWGLRYPMEE